MLTQETLNVLSILLVINGLLVVGLILAPRIRAAWSARPIEAAGSDGADVTDLAAADAARPWFPGQMIDRDRGGNGTDRRSNADPLPGLATAGTWATWLDEEAARVGRYQRTATI
ncbi:MAG: hypothetical protein QOF49_2253, partial [Chloroflexota bacterium]|nr:hypothetical protein [Chloroflexota bacterium]